MRFGEYQPCRVCSENEEGCRQCREGNALDSADCRDGKGAAELVTHFDTIIPTMLARAARAPDFYIAWIYRRLFGQMQQHEEQEQLLARLCCSYATGVCISYTKRGK